jgi:molecular chaperone HscB
MFQQNYFELFGLPVQFNLNRSDLSSAFRQQQTAHHPDKFAHADDKSQRESLQKSAYINQAYQTLSTPTLRAAYLLELAEGKERREHTMRPDAAFLMQQMMWREQLEEAETLDDIESLIETVRSELPVVETSFVSAYEKQDYELAHHAVDKMQFVYKLVAEAESKEARLLDE